MRSVTDETREVTVLELLDRLIDRGVVLAGDLTISVADVHLIYVGLRVLVTSVERAEQLRLGQGAFTPHGAIDA